MPDEKELQDKAIDSLKAKGITPTTDAVKAYILGRKERDAEVVLRLKGYHRE